MRFFKVMYWSWTNKTNGGFGDVGAYLIRGISILVALSMSIILILTLVM